MLVELDCLHYSKVFDSFFYCYLHKFLNLLL